MILLVEDEPDLLEDIALYLSEAGYSVMTARNGQEGWRILQSHPVTLVLCDRVMPQMSGHELLHHLRGGGEGDASLPFIFLTGLVDGQERTAGGPAPTACLYKPIDFEALSRVVAAAIGLPDVSKPV